LIKLTVLTEFSTIIFGLALYAGATDLEPVNIGVISQISGTMALEELSTLDGIRLAADEINAKGGVLGHKLNLLILDRHESSDVTFANFRAAFTTNNVPIIISTIPSSKGLLDLVSDIRVPLILAGPLTQRGTSAPPNRYVYYLTPDLRMEGGAAAFAVADRKKKRFLITGPDLPDNHERARAFRETTLRLNPEAQVIKEIWIGPGEGGVAAAQEKIENEDADIVYSTFEKKEGNRFATDAAGKGKLIVQRVDPSTILPGKEERWAGVQIITLAPPWQDLRRDFIRDLQRRSGTQYFPSDSSVMGYDALYVAVQAVTHANSFEAERLLASLERSYFTTHAKEKQFRFRNSDHVADVPVYEGAWAMQVSSQGDVYFTASPIEGEKLQAQYERVYNAYFLEDGDTNKRPSKLKMNQTFTLGFYVGSPRLNNMLGPQPLDQTLQQSSEEQGVTVNIEVLCRFCQRNQVSQRKTLFIGPQGDTELLKFDVTPVKIGQSELTIGVQYENNLVEAFQIAVHVGEINAETSGSTTDLQFITRESRSRDATASEFKVSDVSQYAKIPRAEIYVDLLRSLDDYTMSFRAPGFGITIVNAKGPEVKRAQKLAEDVWLKLRDLVKGVSVTTNYSKQEQDTFKFEKARKDELLLEMAKIGREMYRTLFLEDPAIAEIMRSFPKSANGDLVTIASDKLYLPWALLYDGDPSLLEAGKVDVKGFWGYRYRMGGFLYDQSMRQVPSTETAYPLSLLYGYYSPESTRKTPDKADQNYMKLRDDQGTQFSDRQPHLKLTKVGTETDFMAALQSPLSYDVIYIYAHGYGGQKRFEVFSSEGKSRGWSVKPDPFDSQIILSPMPPSKQGLKPDDIQRWMTDYRMKLIANPLVFLNICEGEATAAISGENFVRKFMLLGARSVITTDSEIWQNFAQDFATQFFNRFLNSDYDGDASKILWELRRDYLNNRGNPFGFLYTQWGYAGFRPKAP
jgi:branched-chain amino acid transport system substrate-binding protein